MAALFGEFRRRIVRLVADRCHRRISELHGGLRLVRHAHHVQASLEAYSVTSCPAHRTVVHIDVANLLTVFPTNSMNCRRIRPMNFLGSAALLVHANS
jgi:hypothetical protein